MFSETLCNVRSLAPIVHNITNYVTVNDCANILLACGASPIMADDVGEVAEITALCGALCINIGTPNAGTIKSMSVAGRVANELGRPVALDPVGVGASSLRTGTAFRLLDEIRFAVVRGNVSEIKTLARAGGGAKGVDARASDAITAENIDEVATLAKNFAAKTKAVVAVTGAIDVVTNGEKTYLIYNGVPEMSKVTGTGCQLSALVSAFVAANKENALEAAAAAVAAMGLCGEKAKSRMTSLDGNAAFRGYIIDAVYNLTGEELERGAKYEVR